MSDEKVAKEIKTSYTTYTPGSYEAYRATQNIALLSPKSIPTKEQWERQQAIANTIRLGM